MKSNRVLGVGGIVLLAAFAMGTSAQASPLSDVPLSTDGSLSMADTEMGIIMESYWSAEPLILDACAPDDCSESEDDGDVTSGSSFSSAIPENSFKVVSPAPEPATFVLVGLTLAVLPLIRKRRG